MATVVSLTEAKIQELMAGWESVGLSQEQINALVIQLRNAVDSQGAVLTEFNEVTLPQLRADLTAGSIVVSELNDTTIPSLQQTLDAHDLTLTNLNTVTLPALRTDLDSAIENSLVRPQTFFSDEPPVSTEERDLQIGDVWHDTNDGNKQYRWDGVAWVTFSVDIPDFSITARKLISNRHIIY